MTYIKLGFSVATLALAACGPKVPINMTPEKVPVEVAVPVATGCIAKQGRPPEPVSLDETVSPSEWDRLAPGAQAEALKAQAGEWMNYAKRLAAATSACK